MRRANVPIKLHIRRVWSEFSLGAIFDIQGCNVSSCGQQKLWLDWADAQAFLSLRWAYLQEGTFSDVVEFF